MNPEEAETTNKYSLIPILRFVRAVLLMGALVVFILNFTMVTYQLQRSFEQYLSTISAGIGFVPAGIVGLEILYGVQFYNYPTSSTVDHWASGSLLLSVFGELSTIVAPLLYAISQASLMEEILYLTHIALFLTCILIEGKIHISAYSDKNRKKPDGIEPLVTPEDYSIALLDEIARQKEKDRGDSSTY
ncbi:MAG: hypothetical protein ACFFE1_13915 [Candidatus Thorarchaeota archaeon]